MENDNEMMKEIGARIKARREQINMTQEELGNLLGYTQKSAKSSVSRLENGSVKDLTVPLAYLLAKYLRCDPAWLTGWEDGAMKPNDELIDKIVTRLSNDEKVLRIMAMVSGMSDNELEKQIKILNALYGNGDSKK